MASSYAITSGVELFHVVDNQNKTTELPGLLLLQTTGITVSAGAGNADGVASVSGVGLAGTPGSGAGFADGSANVVAVSHLAFAGHADGTTDVAGASKTVVVRPAIGYADGTSTAAAISLVAFVVGNADGSATAVSFSQYITIQTGNADGFAGVSGGVKIPGDGCALIVGI